MNQIEATQLSAPPEQVEFLWVGRGADLKSLCDQWREHDAVALDTEFVRERTFYPALGLVQIATPDEIALIDPKVLDDAQPLIDLLRDPKVTKILHACSEDLETFRHTWGVVPEPLVDTQIAAAMAGLDWSMGYGRLIADLCSVNLTKAHTRTNWLKRPLSDAQKRYAALDVLYLLPAWRQLETRLEELGRMDWLREECAAMLDTALDDLEPEDAYLTIGRARTLDARRLAILQSIAHWREVQARQRDLPRNFVLREQSVGEIAQRRPKTLHQLKRIKGMGPKEIRRDGETLLQLVLEAESLSGDRLPETLRRPVDLAPYADLVKKLRDVVAESAQELGVPQVLLSNRRTVETLVRRHVDGRSPVLPRALLGWREKAIGQRLVDLLNGSEPPRGSDPKG